MTWLLPSFGQVCLLPNADESERNFIVRAFHLLELSVSIPSNEVVLSGTLCLPHDGGKFPTALWLQGSGPIDRDDNMPGLALNNSKSFAHYLAENGIATLRIDKRGVGQSSGNFLEAGHSDFVEDGLNCIRFLSKSARCDPANLFAIGHSEGSYIAPQIAHQFEPMAGIVLLCPSIEDFGSLLMRQATELKTMTQAEPWLERPFAKLYMKMFDPIRSNRKAIEKIRNTNSKKGMLGFSKQPFHWFRQLLSLDLPEVFSRTKCPVLAISGSKDFQCRPSDVIEIKDLVQGEYEFHIIEDMSHLLRNEPGQASAFDYSAQLEKPIDSKVLTVVGGWLKQKSQHGG